MSVWVYADISRDSKALWTRSNGKCNFCGVALERLKSSYGTRSRSYLDGLYACPQCGWWTAEREEWRVEPHVHTQTIYGAVGSLRELDPDDIRAPVREVRKFLLSRYERRFELHPRLFEETVASVFADSGYTSFVTGYSGDDGIDVILKGKGRTIGVQVKRYKNKIKVEQIRSLAGALVLGGMTRGIFVTTSDFQSGVLSTVKRYKTRGYTIELLNADAFYETMKIAQAKTGDLREILRIDRILQNLVEIETRQEVPASGP